MKKCNLFGVSMRTLHCALFHMKLRILLIPSQKMNALELTFDTDLSKSLIPCSDLNPGLKTSLFNNLHFIILNSLKSCNYKEFSFLSTISVVQHNYLIMRMCHKDTKAHNQFDRSDPSANLIKLRKYHNVNSVNCRFKFPALPWICNIRLR